MYTIYFHFNGAKRWREMPFIPRVGEFVTLEDGSESDLRLKIRSVHYGEDHDRGGWVYWTNCEVCD